MNLPHIVVYRHKKWLKIYFNLKILFARQTWDKKQFLILVPLLGTASPDSIKKVNILNIFKHNIKKHYLTWITHNVYMWICLSVFMYVCMSVGVYIYTCGYILICFLLIYPFSCSCFLFFLFTLFSRFYSDLRDHNENNTGRKSTFPKSWNIMENSKAPSKYHLSITFLAQKKTVFPISEKFKTRTLQ